MCGLDTLILTQRSVQDVVCSLTEPGGVLTLLGGWWGCVVVWILKDRQTGSGTVAGAQRPS